MFAVEVYVYLLVFPDQLQRDIFVSKADTTGLGECRVSIAGVVEEFLRHLVSIPASSYFHGAKWRRDHPPLPDTEGELKTVSEFDLVNTLTELSEKLAKDLQFYKSLLFYRKQGTEPASGHQPPPIPIPKHVITKICLFTRSADSYIFPYSQKNLAKHIGDGNVLFKWWIGVLARSLDEGWKCMADIPGSNARAVQRFLPELPNWSIGSIYVDENPDARAVYTIPLFPDDPKGRFLEHLIVENRFKSVTTSQFWEELGFRQEFRLGNVVGIISCTQTKSEPLQEHRENGDRGITNKTYKKLMDAIKGEDFSKKEEIQTFTKSTLPSLIKDAGITVASFEFTGTKIIAPKVEAPRVAQINNLNGMQIKKKRAAVQSVVPAQAPVNNLTGLVKRKKT